MLYVVILLKYVKNSMKLTFKCFFPHVTTLITFFRLVPKSEDKQKSPVSLHITAYKVKFCGKWNLSEISVARCSNLTRCCLQLAWMAGASCWRSARFGVLCIISIHFCFLVRKWQPLRETLTLLWCLFTPMCEVKKVWARVKKFNWTTGLPHRREGIKTKFSHWNP